MDRLISSIVIFFAPVHSSTVMSQFVRFLENTVSKFDTQFRNMVRSRPEFTKQHSALMEKNDLTLSLAAIKGGG